MLGIICLECRGTNGITAAPLEHLIIAMPERGFFFVETLQRPVVPFIQSPVRFNRKMHLVHFIQDQPQRTD